MRKIVLIELYLCIHETSMFIYNEEMKIFRLVLDHDAKFYLFEGIKIYKNRGNTEENDTKN